MTTVLLITEQPRIRQLFAKLEQGKMFRLRVAPTLAQGEEEIAVRIPDYVFVENHISDLSGEIIVRYLTGLLPEESAVFLMALVAADAEQTRKLGGLYLDLSASDGTLLQSVRDAIPADAMPQDPAPADPYPASPQGTRELLFDQPGSGAPARLNKRYLWFIPMVLIVLSLSLFAYHRGKTAPPAPAPKTAAVPPPAAAVPPPPAANSIAGGAAPAAPPGIRAAERGPVAPGTAVPSSGRYVHYVVRPGDTILKIMLQHFGFSYKQLQEITPELKRLNNLNDLDRLKKGQKLIIPVRKAQGKAD